MKKWKHDEVFRTTKCFGSWNNTGDVKICPGGFPNGFMKWVKELGYWGEKRAYLCAGLVPDQDAVRVDIRPEVKPTHCEDARKTSLPAESFDIVIIDPPYSRELAKDLYATDKVYASINEFTKEAVRIVKPGGLILTLTYEIPRRIPGCNFIAVCGVYTIPMSGYMRCFTVSKKGDDHDRTGDK